MKSLLTILILLLHASRTLIAAEAFPLDEDMDGVGLGRNLSVLVDTSQGWSASDLLTSNPDSAWTTQDKDIPHFGVSKGAIGWARFELENRSDRPLSVYLEYGTLAQRIDLYTVQSGQITATESVTDDHKNLQAVQHRFATFQLEIPPGKTQFLLRLQSSVVWFPLKLWSEKPFQEHRSHDKAIITGIVSAIVVLLLFNFFQWLSFRNRSSFYYLFYLATTLLYVLYFTAGWVYFKSDGLQPFFTKAMGGVWYGLALVSITLFGSEFLEVRLRLPRIHRLLRPTIILSFLWIALSLFKPMLAWATPLYIVTLLVGALMIVCSIHGVITRYRPALFYLVSWLFLYLGTYLLTFRDAGWFQSELANFSGPIGFTLQMVLLSMALGDKMRREQLEAREEIARLNASLEQAIEEKTRNIRSILKNIRQGILMIGPDGGMLPDTSDFLEQVFEQKPAPGCRALDFLFYRTKISQDALHQMDSALNASLQEDVLAFELNEDRLCREAIFVNKSGETRILEYDWAPMLKDQVVDRYLVTVKDITEHRLLKLEHHKQEEELQLLKEIVNVDRSVFAKFALQSRRLLADCSEICSRMPDFQPELLKRIFVNLHTIKGTARSLYLRSLTDHIHALEQAIQNDLRNPEQFQKNALAAGLAGIEEGLNLYVDLARKKLGIDLYQQDRIDFDRKEILESLERIEDSLKRSSPSLQDLKRLLQEQQRRFYTRIYADLRATLQGLDIVVRTVAQELEKTVPTLILDVPMNAALTLEGEELLQSIFGHILRNAVDHGIESDADRIRAGKPLRGQLEISVSLADDAVTFVVSDDGRGLDLGAVRSKAENLGMIPKGGTLPALQLAELIFAPGVSTKEQVTLISGRGVGMDAVRTYLREKGGDISLHLKDDRHPEMNCRYFYLTISIPRQLFRFMDEQSIARAS